LPSPPIFRRNYISKVVLERIFTMNSKILRRPYPAVFKPTEGGKPPWLKVKANYGHNYGWVKEMISDLNLHSVCQEALCPNIGECFTAGISFSLGFLVLMKSAPFVFFLINISHTSIYITQNGANDDRKILFK